MLVLSLQLPRRRCGASQHRAPTEWSADCGIPAAVLSSFDCDCMPTLRCVPAQGFHRVEYLLFRERNLTAAEWWAAALVNSSIALSANLLGRRGLRFPQPLDFPEPRPQQEPQQPCCRKRSSCSQCMRHLQRAGSCSSAPRLWLPQVVLCSQDVPCTLSRPTGRSSRRRTRGRA